MAWQDIVLASGGALGAIVSIIHGVLTQRFMVEPIDAALARESSIRGSIRRLNAALLHVSTFAWFVGGLFVVAALWLGDEARLVVCALVGLGYLYAAILNCWATRGRHPGWMLMSVTLVLIVVGASA